MAEEGRRDRKNLRSQKLRRFHGFVNKVALLSEMADHHPDILIRWNKVSITLSTHSEGGITEKDVSLAGEIEGAL